MSKIASLKAFTIVELLVVIVVIGILAAVTIVSYSGVSNRANIASIQAELANNSKKLAMYYVINDTYPTGIDSNGCPSAPVLDTNNCIKVGSGSTYEYTFKTASSYDLYVMKGNLVYKVSENGNPVVSTDPNWITIGSQVWAKRNLNVGTMITGVTAQTNNGGANIIEKYCYNDLESNCTIYGGLYQWNEAMEYVTTESAQGICPTDSHIPSDNEWKILEMQLGMTQMQADLSDEWRGTDQGAQLALGGASDMDILLAGRRYVDGTFNSIDTYANLWASTSSAADTAWNRSLYTGGNPIYRLPSAKSWGFSVRCLKN